MNNRRLGVNCVHSVMLRWVFAIHSLQDITLPFCFHFQDTTSRTWLVPPAPSIAESKHDTLLYLTVT